MATDVITDVPAVVAELGGRGPSSGPGCSTSWSTRSPRTTDLSELRGFAQDSGEGRWTVGRPSTTPSRCRSSPPRCSPASPRARTTPPRMKMIAALRNQYGGHAVTSSAGSTEKGADSPGADATAPVGSRAGRSPRARCAARPGTPPEA